MADISAVIGQLQKNQEKNTVQLSMLNDQMAALNSGLISMVKGLQKSLESLAMDNLEKSREEKRDKDQVKSKSGPGIKMPPLTSFQGILAGIAAVGAALSGLRGWEASAIKNIKSIGRALRSIFLFGFISKLAGWIIPEKFKTWGEYFKMKMGNLKTGILKALGFDVTLAKFNDPKSGLKLSLASQIQNGLTNLRASLTGRIYQMMGLGIDGKPIVVQDAAGKFKKGELTVVGKLIRGFNMIITPFVKIADGITDFIGGAGSKIFAFLKSFGLVAASGAGVAGKAVGGIAKLFGKLLWPIGVLFSAFDGIKTFIETEGSIFEKTLAGIYGFLGDFIGAPLDLIKGGFIFLLKKKKPINIKTIKEIL